MMYTSQKLRMIAIAAYGKMFRNRFKDAVQDPKGIGRKWQIDAHDEQGGRTWHNALPGFLNSKLVEEVNELFIAAGEMYRREGLPDSGYIAEQILLEAGDVCAMAMMIADRANALRDLDQVVPKVVCLCGSTKFKDAFVAANFKETMAGNIVLSVGFFAHVDASYTLSIEEKMGLDVLHKRKIDLADEIFILNVDGYVGESTMSEIQYALATGKPMRWLEPEKQFPIVNGRLLYHETPKHDDTCPHNWSIDTISGEVTQDSFCTMCGLSFTRYTQSMP